MTSRSTSTLGQPLAVDPADPHLPEARVNCAANLRNRGYYEEAAMFECGARDQTWQMKHELARLRTQAALATPAAPGARIVPLRGRAADGQPS